MAAGLGDRFRREHCRGDRGHCSAGRAGPNVIRNIKPHGARRSRRAQAVWSHALRFRGVRSSWCRARGSQAISVTNSGSIPTRPRRSGMRCSRPGNSTGIRAIGTHALEHGTHRGGLSRRVRWSSCRRTKPYVPVAPARRWNSACEWLVDFKKPNFNGRRALAEEKRNGSTWQPGKTRHRGQQGRRTTPIYLPTTRELSRDNIGFTTSAVWSPVCKQNIALGTVSSASRCCPADTVWVEIYYQREMHWNRNMVARAEPWSTRRSGSRRTSQRNTHSGSRLD